MNTQLKEQPPLPSYYAFDPVVAGDYTIGLELLANIIDEVKDLHKAHWEETEVAYLKRPVDPDYGPVILRESQRAFVFFTVRDVENKVIGNLGYYIGPSTRHKDTMQASEDLFFIAKDHRRGRVAMRLMKYAEECLIKLNVKVISMSDKSPIGGKTLDTFFTREGYQRVSVNYFKEV